MRIAQPFGRDPLEQPILHLPRRLSRRQAGAIAHPEDVGIDRHGALTEGDVQHHVRGLAANPGQSFQRSPVPRHLAAVLLLQRACQSHDVACLGLPQPDRADVRCHAIHAEIDHRLRGRRYAEQGGRRLVDRQIRRLGRQHHRDQQGEGVGEGEFGLRCGIMVRKSLDEAAHLRRASWRVACGAWPWRHAVLSPWQRLSRAHVRTARVCGTIGRDGVSPRTPPEALPLEPPSADRLGPFTLVWIAEAPPLLGGHGQATGGFALWRGCVHGGVWRVTPPCSRR